MQFDHFVKFLEMIQVFFIKTNSRIMSLTTKQTILIHNFNFDEKP